MKWKKSEMIYRLHACIFKNTKKDLHFKQNCVISVTRFDTFNIWKKYKFFFSKFLKKFLENFFWNVVFWLPNKDFRPLKKKIFSKKNLFYNLKYFFKCRMCQIWSLKWQNFVKNANPFLYSWRYIHAMYKSLQFSIISNHL